MRALAAIFERSERPAPRLRGVAMRLRRQGFTLLEILAASAIFAVIVGAMVSIFYGAIRMRENAYKAFQEQTPTDAVIAVIKGDLENCVPAGTASAGIVLAGPLLGTKQGEGDVHADTLELYAASGRVDDRYPWGEIQRVDYSLEPPQDTGDNAAQGLDLTRGVTRNLLATIEQEPEAQILLKGVRSLTFTYYDGQEWQDSWDSTTQSPVTQGATAQDSTTQNSTTQQGGPPLAIKARIEFEPPAEGQRPRLPIEVTAPIVMKAPA